MPSLLTGAI